MSVLLLPLAPELSVTTPAPVPTPLLEELATLRLENAALRTEKAVLHERIRELEARLGQTSANSSRPLASDPPQAPARPKAPPSGRRRGGQPGHRGVHRALLPVEQGDEIVAVVPECCPKPTNNVAERALRPTVLWRKGSFGCDSEAGSRFAERLLTVAATCRQQGRALLDLLVAAGEAGLRGTAAPSLLPTDRGEGNASRDSTRTVCACHRAEQEGRDAEHPPGRGVRRPPAHASGPARRGRGPRARRRR